MTYQPLKEFMIERGFVSAHAKIRQTPKGYKHVVFFDNDGNKEFVHFSKDASSMVNVGDSTAGLSKRFKIQKGFNHLGEPRIKLVSTSVETENQNLVKISYSELKVKYKKDCKIPYYEFLETKEWQEKRIEILARDKHKCTNPDCSSNLLFSINGFMTIKEFMNQLGLIEVHSKVRETSKGIKYVIFFDASGHTTNVIFSKIGSFEINVGDSVEGLSNRYNICIYEISNKETNQSVTNFRLSLINEKFDPTIINNLSGTWVDISSMQSSILQIHHKFYVTSWLPWNYPEDALITLCSNCHQNLHNTQRIKSYRETKDYILEETDCKKCNRCSGSGYLLQYDHVLNGVCFNCGGLGFEPEELKKNII